MKRVLGAIFVLACVACKTEKGSAKSEGRDFLFTGEFPAGVQLEILTHFESTTDNPLCKNLSMGSGKMEPAQKSVSEILKTSGDTLSVPLYYNHASLCSWEFQDLQISVVPNENPCLNSPSVSMGVGPLFADKSQMPDSIRYVCRKEIDRRCLVCSANTDDENRTFRLENPPMLFHLAISIE